MIKVRLRTAADLFIDNCDKGYYELYGYDFIKLTLSDFIAFAKCSKKKDDVFIHEIDVDDLSQYSVHIQVTQLSGEEMIVPLFRLQVIGVFMRYAVERGYTDRNLLVELKEKTDDEASWMFLGILEFLSDCGSGQHH